MSSLRSAPAALALALLAACAQPGATNSLAGGSPAPSRDGPRAYQLIRHGEIAGAAATNVLELIQEVRGSWLETRPLQQGARVTDLTARPSNSVVFHVTLDGRPVGDLRALQRMPTEYIEQVRLRLPTPTPGGAAAQGRGPTGYDAVYIIEVRSLQAARPSGGD